MHIAHMTMPFSRPGSAVTNVVRNLVLAHPGKTTVVTSHNRDVEVDGADNLRVDFTGTCPREYFDRFEMAVDHFFGILNRERPFTGQLPLAAVEALRTVQPDVVFVHEGHFASSALPLFRRGLPDAKILLYVHTQLARSYTRRELRRLLSNVDGIVCVSQFIENMVRRRLGEPALSIPIHSVINGVDPARFHPPETVPAPTELLFVGQMNEQKGADLAAKAIHSLPQSVHLRLIGSSVHGATGELTSYEQNLRKLDAKSNSKITFEPFQPNALLPEIYRSAGIVLVPSRFQDPCPLVCLEALASGCVVIGSNRGGIPAICESAAVIVEPDSGAIAKALQDLINDPVRYRDLRIRARRRAEELQWNSQYQKLLNFVQQIS